MPPDLMAHQTEALDFLQGKSGGALFYEMGLGKSLIILEHLNRNMGLPALVICPLSAVYVWKNESEKFGYPFRFKILTGAYKERVKALGEEADIYVINYEGLRVIGHHLEKKGFVSVVCDESHRVKERTTIQTAVALGLAQEIPNRYILSGTPVSKSPEDIWTQIRIVNPDLLGNFYSFRANYVDYRKMTVRTPRGPITIQKAYRFKNATKLKEILKPWVLRKTKKECLDLPEKIYQTIHCDLSEEQKKHYFSLKNSLATLLNEKQLRLSSAAALLQKLQQVCQGFLYGEDGEVKYFESGKVKILKDLLEDIHEKAIIFTWFRADNDRLCRELSGVRSFILYDGTASERSEKEKAFQASTEPLLFIANIEVAKESITLNTASNVIYFGNSWNYASRCQSEDRAHRIGTKKNVLYTDLVVPGTIDETIQYVLKRKGKLADTLLSDTARLAQMVIGSKQ